MTDIDVHPGVLHRGAGLVARWIGVAVVIGPDPAQREAVEAMLGELGHDPDPADVVRSIRELTIDDSTLTSVAYLMMATGGPLAMAQGPTEILVDEEVVLRGADGPNELQITNGDRLTIRLAGDEAASIPVAVSDLRRGVASGGGITFGTVRVTASEPGPAPPPEPPTTSSPSLGSRTEEPVKVEVPFRSVLLFDAASGGRPGSADPQRQPLPVAEPRPAPLPVEAPTPLPIGEDTQPPVRTGTGQARAETIDEDDDDAVIVEGIVCSRDHFNNPAAAFCMVCGISMVHVTHNLVPGPRPTLGFVVFDDGSTFGLDRSYVVGREPGETGEAHTAALTIQDNNETLSRRHAEIRLIDWTVHIVDLGSTNGTFIWDTSFERWNRTNPGQPVPLSPGDTVALGRRTFVFESVTRL